jgi:DNA polymerase-3 subunit delta
VSELEREAASRIPEEMAAQSLTGGRRAVRLREATDATLPHIARGLKGNGAGFLIVEAPGLLSRSKLRTLFKGLPDAAAIGCYPVQGRDLLALIRDMLTQAGVEADSDALAWLADQLGADMAVTQREIEKLILYVGPAGLVDVESARVSVGDLSGLSMEDALFAATAGDVTGTDRALELAVAEGATSVGVLRQALGHLQRLHRTRLAMAGGLSAGEAAKSVRPPLFFRREPAFVQALGLWSADALQAACQRVWDAERACKRTGAPDLALARSAVLGLAQRAAAARRR